LTDTLNFRTVCYFLANLINDPSSLKLQSKYHQILDMRRSDLMSKRVKTNARALVLTRSSQPENGHLRKNVLSCTSARQNNHVRFTGKCMLYSLCQLPPEFSMLFPFKRNNSLYISFQSFINTQILTISHSIT
jgi:hypothetical protein